MSSADSLRLRRRAHSARSAPASSRRRSRSPSRAAPAASRTRGRACCGRCAPRSRAAGRAVSQFRSLMTSDGVVAAVGEPRVLRQRLVAPILAAEKAAGERRVGQERHAALSHQRHEVALDLAHQQAVFVLAGDEGCGADARRRCRARRKPAARRSSSSRSRAPCRRGPVRRARAGFPRSACSDRESGPDRDRYSRCAAASGSPRRCG